MFERALIDLAKHAHKLCSHKDPRVDGWIQQASRAMRQLCKHWGGKLPDDLQALWNAAVTASESARGEAAARVRDWLDATFELTPKIEPDPEADPDAAKDTDPNHGPNDPTSGAPFPGGSDVIHEPSGDADATVGPEGDGEPPSLAGVQEAAEPADSGPLGRDRSSD